MPRSKIKEKVVKLPKTLIPFQLAAWCEDYFYKNKKIPTQKEIEKANVELTKRSLLRNSTYGVMPILNLNHNEHFTK